MSNPRPMAARARPSELLAIVLALAEHEGRDYKERSDLTRKVGVENEGASDSALLAAWVERSASEGLRLRIDRIRKSLAWFGRAMVIFGFLFGWTATSALLSFEIQGGRINIVFCLALLVLLPLVSLVFSCLAASVSRFRYGPKSQRRIPGSPSLGPLSVLVQSLA